MIENIPIIIECRNIIDSYRSWNADRMAWLAITPDEYYKDAKELLEIDRTTKILEMNEVMKKNRFVHDDGSGSVASFYEFNKKFNFEVFKLIRPIYGECDMCGEVGINNQKCIKIISNPCSFPVPINLLYEVAYNFRKKGIIKDIVYSTIDELPDKINNFCPEGHGFYYKKEDYIKGFPIDIFWGE